MTDRTWVNSGFWFSIVGLTDDRESAVQHNFSVTKVAIANYSHILDRIRADKC